MYKQLLLALGLCIAPGLYAMDEDAQFKREQETKAAHYAQEFEEDELTIRDIRSAGERYQQWLAEDQSPEKHAQKLERLAVTQQTDKILSRDCKVSLAKAALLPTAVQECIWSFATDSKKRYIINHMEQLIPAIIKWIPRTGAAIEVPPLIAKKSIFECLEYMKTDRVTLDQINQQRAQLAAIAGGEIPAIILSDNKLYYLGNSFWENDRWGVGCGSSMELTPKLPEQRKLLQDSLSNKINALYYSSGAVIFKVHDSKRAELEQLSSRQLEYIVNLYHTRARNLAERNTAEIHLTPEQIRIHKSLPTNMRVNLQNTYDLVEIKQERAAANRRKQCCTRLAFASLAATLGFNYLWQ